MSLFAFALGLPTLDRQGACIDCFFPAPVKAPAPEQADAIGGHFQAGAAMLEPEAARAFVQAHQPAIAPLLEADRPLVAVLLPADAAIASTPEAFLKLHLLSHRLALPNTLNLDGIFAHLRTVAWTTAGAVAVEELAAKQLRARIEGRHFAVLAVDKFPKMADYVVPSGVRLADSNRIRLGAYLGDGTTVMPAGAVNFNAAALGPNMVEGRISQGVIVGADSDLGGAASTMGTLSGGGEIKISIGRQCLIGANAGTGIPLGDRCTIEAGLYVTAGSPVVLIDERGRRTGTVKARELANRSDLLFIRHSGTGELQCRVNPRAIALNEQLHAHN